MSLDPALRSRIESLLQSNRVVLFMKGEPTTPQCGFSAKAVGALDALGVDYAHVDVLADPDIREGIKVYGDWPTIPQLYIDGELVGGSDIIEQMANSGELASLLGLAAPDRTPPAITITPAAAEMLRNAVADAGRATRCRCRSRAVPAQPAAGAGRRQRDRRRIRGVRVQFDLASARRADGITIDWVDDERGRGLVIDNPNAPPPVQTLSPAEADARVRAGKCCWSTCARPTSARSPRWAPFETFEAMAAPPGSAAQGHRPGVPVPPRRPQPAGGGTFPRPGFPRGLQHRRRHQCLGRRHGFGSGEVLIPRWATSHPVR